MRKIVLTILFFFTFSSIVFADTEGAPIAYTAETADKKYLFVMLTPNCEYCWGSDKYKQSGMYLNDGSITPLWTVDWQRTVFLPSNGKHVVRLGKWSDYSATYQEEVFSFVSEGNILKTYKTKDLIDFPWLLPHSASHYRIINSSFTFKRSYFGDAVTMKINEREEYTLNANVKIDEENSTILIETLHSDNYLFDLKTGNIISSEHPTRNTAIKLFTLLLILYFAYLYAVSKLKLTKFFLKMLNFGVGFFLTMFLFVIPIISVSVHQFVQIGDEFKGYPRFREYAYLSIQMLPRYLLTSLNLINPPESYLLLTDLGTSLIWIATFWIPSILFLGFVTHFLTLKLIKK